MFKTAILNCSVLTASFVLVEQIRGDREKDVLKTRFDQSSEVTYTRRDKENVKSGLVILMDRMTNRAFLLSVDVNSTQITRPMTKLFDDAIRLAEPTWTSHADTAGLFERCSLIAALQ